LLTYCDFRKFDFFLSYFPDNLVAEY